MGDERVGIGATGGVEEVVHLRGEQVELVAQDRQRGLAARHRAPVRKVARQTKVRRYGLGEIARRGPDHRVGVRTPGSELIEARDRLAHDRRDAKDARLDDRWDLALRVGDERIERGEDVRVSVGRGRRLFVPSPKRDHAVGESPSFKGSCSAATPLTSAARTRLRYSCDLSISVCNDVIV